MSEAQGLARFKGDVSAGPALSAEEIMSRRAHVLDVWNAFKTSAAHRRAKLEDSRTLQQFLRDGDELETWISQKLAIAADHDVSNLQGKIKKHQTFDAEIIANEEVITKLHDRAQVLISNSIINEIIRNIAGHDISCALRHRPYHDKDTVSL